MLIFQGLALLLLTATPAQPDQTRPTATITLRNGNTVTVQGPEAQPWAEELVSWKLLATVYSPDRNFAAVHFRWSVPKYSSSRVYLVRSNAMFTELGNSDVESVEWTADSKYLLGFGANTFRLWNLSGGRRQLTFSIIRDHGLSGQRVCMQVSNYSPKTGQKGALLRTYSVPSLKLLSSVPALETDTCAEAATTQP